MASGQQVWRSRIVYVNKMDRAGADFLRVIEQIKSVWVTPCSADPAGYRF